MKQIKSLSFLLSLLLLCFQLSLNAQEVAGRHVPASVIDSFKNAKAYEYANDPAYWKKVKPGGDSLNIFDKILNPAVLKVLGYGFLVAILIFIIYRLIANGVFYRGEKISEELHQVQDDGMQFDEASLKSLLKEFLRDGKYKEAIRAQYLLTLLSLERSGLIKLDPNATNHDYSDQLKGHKAHSAFSFLTRMYEYAWYGDITVSEQDYAFAQKRFVDFKQQF